MSYEFYTLAPDPGTHTVSGDVLVDAEDSVIAGAKQPIPEGTKVYRKAPITFKLLSLTGKNRRAIADAEQAMEDAQKAMFELVADAPQAAITEVAVDLFTAASGEVSLALVKGITDARTNELQRRHMADRAMADGEAVSAVERRQTDTIQIAREKRAAILWGVPVAQLDDIRDFPGAYGVDYSTGFMARWITHTDKLAAEIVNFQNPAGDSPTP